MEIADRDEFYESPRHPYTKALLATAPIPDPTVKRERIILKGDIPSPLNPPSGCVFRTRCPHVIDACASAIPQIEEVGLGHSVACIRQKELADTAG